MNLPSRRTRLILARHGATAWTAAQRHQGATDVPLSEEGQWQSACLAAALAPRPLAAVVCSPLRRARETAACVAAPHGLEPGPEPAFTELCLGAWEGLTGTEAAARDPHPYARWIDSPAAVRPPGGETLADGEARALPALRALLTHHEGSTVALIGHSLVIRILLCHALGAGLDAVAHMKCQLCSIAVVDFHHCRGMVRRINDTCHLDATPQ